MSHQNRHDLMRKKESEVILDILGEKSPGGCTIVEIKKGMKAALGYSSSDSYLRSQLTEQQGKNKVHMTLERGPRGAFKYALGPQPTYIDTTKKDNVCNASPIDKMSKNDKLGVAERIILKLEGIETAQRIILSRLTSIEKRQDRGVDYASLAIIRKIALDLNIKL